MKDEFHTCSVDGCSITVIHAKSFCRKHYYQHHNAAFYLRTKEAYKQRARALREEVLVAYGHKCECCGVTDSVFLNIDHINGDGAAHRKTVSSGHLCRWLKQQGFPKDNFRILCRNCNWAVQFGRCPHT